MKTKNSKSIGYSYFSMDFRMEKRNKPKMELQKCNTLIYSVSDIVPYLNNKAHCCYNTLPILFILELAS